MKPSLKILRDEKSRFRPVRLVGIQLIQWHYGAPGVEPMFALVFWWRDWRQASVVKFWARKTTDGWSDAS